MARWSALPEPAATLEEQGRLALTIWGSRSCPIVAASWRVQDDSTLVVELSGGDAAVCTADLTPTTSLLALSEDVHHARDLTLRLRWPMHADRGETVVIARRG